MSARSSFLSFLVAGALTVALSSSSFASPATKSDSSAAVRSAVTRSLNYVPNRDGSGSVVKVNYWPQDVVNRMPNWLVQKLYQTGHYQEFEDHLWYMYNAYGEWAVDWYYTTFSSVSSQRWTSYRSQLESAVDSWESIVQDVCTRSQVYSCDQTQRYEAIGATITSWVNSYLRLKSRTLLQEAFSAHICLNC